MTYDRNMHMQIMMIVLGQLRDAPVIFKGGSALMLYYGLSRFSEDLDFDGTQQFNLLSLLTPLCIKAGWIVNETKNSKTTQRCMIHYGQNKPLKVEVSFRQVDKKTVDIVKMNDGTIVYSPSAMLLLKGAALAGRDKARDIYDVWYILKNIKELDDNAVATIRAICGGIGLDLLEYKFTNGASKDNLIDGADSAQIVLEIFETLGLI